MEWLTLTIDGREVSVLKGTTVLEACRRNDIPIPTLCHDPELTAAEPVACVLFKSKECAIFPRPVLPK